MVEKINLFDVKDRQEAFNSRARLEEFDYNDNDIANFIQSEKDLGHEQAEGFYFEHYHKFHTFKQYLDNAKGIEKVSDMARWLNESLNYYGVNIKGNSKPVLFNMVIGTKYESNIKKMFNKEKNRLKREMDKSSKYIFR